MRRRADDVEGDQMRQMARHRQREIVMFRRRRLDLGAQPLPKFGEFLHHAGVGVRRRREQAPAILEQSRKA